MAITNPRWKLSAAVCIAVFALSVFLQPAALANSEKQKAAKPFALIFGTAFGPDDRPLYGVKVTIHPIDKKHPSWELMSDHRGEFAQRVPAGTRDYLVVGEITYAPAGPDGQPQKSKAKRLKAEKKVHVDNEERLDIGLHLTE
jgi:hypothetical protein